MRHFYFLLLLSCFRINISAQDKVYPKSSLVFLGTNRGFLTGIEFQAGFGPTDLARPASGSFTGINALVGYRIKRKFLIAAGTGILIYRKVSMIPFFIDTRYAMKVGKLTPYLFTDAGFLLKVSNPGYNEVFINPGIGTFCTLTNKFTVILASGFWIQGHKENASVFVNFKTGIHYKF